MSDSELINKVDALTPRERALFEMIGLSAILNSFTDAEMRHVVEIIGAICDEEGDPNVTAEDSLRILGLSIDEEVALEECGQRHGTPEVVAGHLVGERYHYCVSRKGHQDEPHECECGVSW